MASIDQILSTVKAQLGKPYVYGATGPNSYDCSGLLYDAFRRNGVTIPRTSEDQAKIGAVIPKELIAPGDLVFSDWGDGPNSHVGIATSHTQIIDAPHTGTVVRYDQLTSGYLSHVTAVRRIPLDGAALPPGAESAGGTSSGGGGFWDPVVKPFADLGQAATSVAKVADLVTKAFLPTNVVRIVCGLVGAIFIGMGILMLTREVRPV